MEYGEEAIRPIDNTIYLVVFCAMFYGGAYPHLGNVFVSGEKSMVLVCTFLCDIVACFMCKNIIKDWFKRRDSSCDCRSIDIPYYVIL